MWIDEPQDEDKEAGWLGRVGRFGFGLVVLGAVGALIYSFANQHVGKAPHSVTTITRVLLPPPPPPKPPEPVKTPEQPKMEAPKPREKPEEKPQQPKPVQAPPHSPLTAAAGTGPNPFGLQVGNGSGDVIGGGNGTESSEKWRLYAGLVGSQIRESLKRDDKFRFGRWRLSVQIWLSASGTVTRAAVVNSSGDSSVDSAVVQRLDGLGVGQPPPRDMPEPVRLRIAAEPG